MSVVRALATRLYSCGILQGHSLRAYRVLTAPVRCHREAMEARVDAGRAKHLGVSNFSLAQVRHGC